MVESSKILTVSYGTFSCTLEGFDDSFSTMKAIAEYFRDLAAGDRYFGAEPPTPDAEMMAKIAQSQAAQHVEASSDENGIVLRAAAAALTAAKSEPEISADEAAPAMPPQAQPPAEEQVAPVAEHLPEEPVIPTPVVDEMVVATPEAGEDTSPLLVAESVAAPEFDAEVSDEMDVNGVSSFDDMSPDAIERAPLHPDADSVAAKLQRIRAVVGAGAATMPAERNDVVSEPVEVEDIAIEETSTPEILGTSSDETDIENTADDDTGEFYEDEDVSDIDVTETVETADQSETVDLDALSSKLSSDEESSVASVSEENPTEETLEATPQEPDFDEVTELQTDGSDDEFENDDSTSVEIDSALIASIANASADNHKDEPVIEEESSETANADLGDAEEIEDEAPEKLSITARILRAARPNRNAEAAVEEQIEEETDVKMDDVISAIEGSAEDVTNDFDDLDMAANDGADELTEFTDIPVSDLSPEDEAELQDELAEVAQEIEAQQVEAAPQRNTLPENDDASMSRIMDQTDQELSEPEGSRRRQAIAQLKAAVAATEASRQLGDAESSAEEAESEFRDDLEQVVRPRRADRLPRAEVRKERPRPAPLKLVASQRIDEGAGSIEELAPVSPRRVATSDEATNDAANFAEFAAEMGASELADLLEAAAAYTSFVEGKEDFSRPQIMKKVQLTITEGFSREDGLRTFGTLLREGRISKVRNGRFQVSDQTRFKPEQKAG